MSVGINDRDSIANFLLKKGVEVRILNKEEVLMDYITGGDEVRSISYFMNPVEQVPYIVNLPGYDSYVAGIYAAPEQDWKSRFILEVDWSSLKEVQAEFLQNPGDNFKIEYQDDFFHLGTQKESLDSASVFDYIEELANFQVNTFIELTQNIKYDSLSASDSQLRLTISLIGKEDQVLEIYPIQPGDNHQLGMLNGEDAVLINPRALIPLLKKKEDW